MASFSLPKWLVEQPNAPFYERLKHQILLPEAASVFDIVI